MRVFPQRLKTILDDVPVRVAKAWHVRVNVLDERYAVRARLDGFRISVPHGKQVLVCLTGFNPATAFIATMPLARLALSLDVNRRWLIIAVAFSHVPIPAFLLSQSIARW